MSSEYKILEEPGMEYNVGTCTPLKIVFMVTSSTDKTLEPIIHLKTTNGLEQIDNDIFTMITSVRNGNIYDIEFCFTAGCIKYENQALLLSFTISNTTTGEFLTTVTTRDIMIKCPAEHRRIVLLEYALIKERLFRKRVMQVLLRHEKQIENLTLSESFMEARAIGMNKDTLPDLDLEML